MANLRKLGRRTDHRTAMLRNQVSSLFLYGRITTTVTRAKETQKMAEKLITEAKKETLAGNRAISSELYSNEVARKVVEEIAPAMKNRNGGYTRVLKVGRRRGDAADMAILELVKDDVTSEKTKKAAKPTQEANNKVKEESNEAEKASDETTEVASEEPTVEEDSSPEEKNEEN